MPLLGDNGVRAGPRSPRSPSRAAASAKDQPADNVPRRHHHHARIRPRVLAPPSSGTTVSIHGSREAIGSEATTSARIAAGDRRPTPATPPSLVHSVPLCPPAKSSDRPRRSPCPPASRCVTPPGKHAAEMVTFVVSSAPSEPPRPDGRVRKSLVRKDLRDDPGGIRTPDPRFRRPMLNVAVCPGMSRKGAAAAQRASIRIAARRPKFGRLPQAAEPHRCWGAGPPDGKVLEVVRGSRAAPRRPWLSRQWKSNCYRASLRSAKAMHLISVSRLRDAYFSSLGLAAT